MSRRTPKPMVLRILGAIACASARHQYQLATPTLRAMLIAERADAWVFKARMSA